PASSRKLSGEPPAAMTPGRPVWALLARSKVASRIQASEIAKAIQNGVSPARLRTRDRAEPASPSFWLADLPPSRGKLSRRWFFSSAGWIGTATCSLLRTLDMLTHCPLTRDIARSKTALSVAASPSLADGHPRSTAAPSCRPPDTRRTLPRLLAVKSGKKWDETTIDRCSSASALQDSAIPPAWDANRTCHATSARRVAQDPTNLYPPAKTPG